jgi:alpha-L-rhamnosidase
LVVDGMARERQQYAGDGATQLHVARLAHGMAASSARFLRQFGFGQNKSGIWFDSWPAYDRLARLGQRQIDAASWGVIVDHSIGFVMEHVHHWLQTGDLPPYLEHRDQIRKFEDYLQTIKDENGLLKAEEIGTDTVWIDHDSYHHQSHKKLALNLYHMQMQVMLGWLRGERPDLTSQIEALRSEFWDTHRGAFVNNPPLTPTGSPRYCDRSIHHILWLHAQGYEVAPDLTATLRIIQSTTKSLGIGYPVNSCWRHWAWTRLGRVDLVLKELREVWANLYSVKNNLTIQEMWDIRPGTTSMMSHCGVIPTLSMLTCILGLGHGTDREAFIRPQLGNLQRFEIEFMIQGQLARFIAEKEEGYHRCELDLKHTVAVPILTYEETKNGVVTENETLAKAGETTSLLVFPYPPGVLIPEG